MEYRLFEEYIVLQALLKEIGIIQSGGAIKSFLQETPVFLNGEREERRRKKIRIGDDIHIPSKNITISILEPSEEEIERYQEEKSEKERVAKIVKEMNKGLKKTATKPKTTSKQKPKKAPVRFPGT
ncbi:RNA-binding S4 domain-containing protein [Streptococcus pneumoniae]